MRRFSAPTHKNLKPSFISKTMAVLCTVLFAGVYSLSAQKNQQQTFTLSGYIYDSENGEALIGATVHAKELKQGTVSNLYGFYSLTLPAGKVKITYSFIGMAPVEKEIDLTKNVELNLRLKPADNSLKEIVVSATRNEEREHVRSTQMSTIKVPMEQIKHIPSLGGEVDVVKVMQLMPGVKRGGEGATGMYVRGGAADQNLIVLDEAIVYNISHLFGFFSVFNNDALKDVTMIKGGFPANYGGRISSIMDVRMKEGNMNKYQVEGGIGLLSSRLTLQGPVIDDKMSFLVSGRRSYIDQVLGASGLKVPYYFYDLNGKLNYKLSDKDRLYYSAYFGNDVLSEPKLEAGQNDTGGNIQDLGLDFGFTLGNFTNTLRWNHLINPKMFSNLSVIYTRFKYDIDGKFGDNSVFIGSKIRDIGVKLDYDYYKNPRNHFKFGGSIYNHIFRPNVVSTQGSISEEVKSNPGATIMTQEGALYAMNDFALTNRLNINYGFRLSSLLTDSKVYLGPEPRFSASYVLSPDNSIKLGYSRMYQYMHLVSSSSVALPTDLWYPVTDRIRPQHSDQVAAGYSHYVDKLKSTFTLEAYYKSMKNLIEYREGAVLILNDNYEDELLHGTGRAYGFEFFMNKTKGRFNGWVGYSLSWANRHFDELNNGNRFPAKFDRRHDISIVGNFDITDRITFSAVWVYSTGQRFTPRLGQFAMPNPEFSNVDILPVYGARNSVELSSAHRLDVNLVIKRKPNKKWEGEWNIGAYNLYNRAQPYKIKVVEDGKGGFKYQEVGLFGFIPSIAYNFKF